MARPSGRRAETVKNTDADLKSAGKAVTASALSTLIVILALIAVMLFGITLLYRH